MMAGVSEKGCPWPCTSEGYNGAFRSLCQAYLGVTLECPGWQPFPVELLAVSRPGGC